ncbi:MAG: alanine/glycine:cation symporter family protein [Clostridia bacterium]|nr:alanine/glycine:cation symporter family protein [Clostridia bacterium]
MVETVTKINDFVYGIVWGWPAIILLGFVGVLMTFLTKFFQVSHFGHWMKKTIGAIFSDKHVIKHTKDKSISQFQSLCTALAATVGTGNIVGVAGAIAIGGPGSIFWMWLIAFFGMMTNYSENVLGILYRRKNQKGEWAGGAMYYLQDGLGAKKHCKHIGKILAAIFSVCCLFASFGIGNLAQIRSIVSNVNTAFHIPNIVTGIVLCTIVGLVVVGGIKRIALVTEKIVPFMVVAYFIGTVIIICMNIKNVPAAFVSIFQGAFNLKSAAGGAVGSGIALAMKMGFKRGVFSNESGLGSSVMVHSSSNVKEPVRQGMWGIFEVFADTIVVCTLTAITILVSGAIDLTTGQMTAEAAALGSDSLMNMAFSNAFGQVGSAFIAIAILLFAFSTVLGWSHYGSTACEYLFGLKITKIYKVFFTALVIISSVVTSQLAWDLSDTFNGMMMIPNLIGVLVLAPQVMRCTQNYIDRHFRHKDVKPMLSMIPELEEEEVKDFDPDETEYFTY